MVATGGPCMIDHRNRRFVIDLLLHYVEMLFLHQMLHHKLFEFKIIIFKIHFCFFFVEKGSILAGEHDRCRSTPVIIACYYREQ